MLRRSVIFAVFLAVIFLGDESKAASCFSGSCHKSLTTTKFLHGPVAAEMAGARGCVACHVPAGRSCSKNGKGIFKPLVPSEKMCQVCHSRGTGTQHSSKRIDCLKCHDPHGSNKNAELKR